MFERRTDPLLPFPRFLGRVVRSALLAFALVTVALGIGILGYHEVAQQSWIDATMNAAMILTGMGPVNPLSNSAAKLFASAYALFSGVIFLSSIALVISPIFHRFLHRFHFEDEDDEKA